MTSLKLIPPACTLVFAGSSKLFWSNSGWDPSLLSMLELVIGYVLPLLEIALGLLLVISPRTAVIPASALFYSFSTFLFALDFAGKSTCNCFGDSGVRVRLAMALDFGLLSLIISTPEFRAIQMRLKYKRAIAACCFIAFPLAALVFSPQLTEFALEQSPGPLRITNAGPHKVAAGPNYLHEVLVYNRSKNKILAATIIPSCDCARISDQELTLEQGRRSI